MFILQISIELLIDTRTVETFSDNILIDKNTV